MTETTLNGQCLCGAVTVSGTPGRPHIEACHCAMCRCWAGGVSLGVPCGSDVSFTGETHITRYRSSEWAERGFCKRCGSNLFYRFIPADNYSLAIGLFKDTGALTLGEQVFIDEKPDYYDFAQDTPKKTGAELIAEAKEAGFNFD